MRCASGIPCALLIGKALSIRQNSDAFVPRDRGSLCQWLFDIHARNLDQGTRDKDDVEGGSSTSANSSKFHLDRSVRRREKTGPRLVSTAAGFRSKGGFLTSG